MRSLTHVLLPLLMVLVAAAATSGAAAQDKAASETKPAAAAEPAEPAADERVKPPVRLAYIWTNQEAANSFKRLLDAEGLRTDLVRMNAVRDTSLASYAAILIASDTQGAWGELARVVDHAKKPILGLGEGGYSFFGSLNLSIGSPHGWHGRNASLIPVNASESKFWSSLRPAVSDKVLTAYETTNHVGIHLPGPVRGVSPLGQEVNSRTHYVLVQQDPRYVLWGFAGSPETMTTAGRKLFVHTCRYAMSLITEGGDQDGVAPERPEIVRPPTRRSIPQSNLQIPDEMKACAANLGKISAAIKKYEKDNGKLPDWLSDLVPDYLGKEVLLCPSHRTPKAYSCPDPKLPCS